jgi:hypothetical protein
MTATTAPVAQARPPALRFSSPLVPLLLTPIVLIVNGYHPFAGDAGIYIAGVRHILSPTLYPLNAVFITAFTRYSLFAWTLAAIVRLTHLPLAWTLLAAYLVSIALYLTGIRQLAIRLFTSESARGCAVLLAAATCALPVAGTALVLMDPYLTARSFSTPLALCAVAACLDRASLRTALLLVLTTLLHPLMGAYAVAFVALLALVQSGRMRPAITFCAAAFLAAGAAFAIAHRLPASDAYREAVSLAPRSFLFLARWHWYEILGLVLPLALFTLAMRQFPRTSAIRPLCAACLLTGTTAILIAACFIPPAGPFLLVPLQILRSFHLIYAVGVVLCGGALSALINRSRLTGIAILCLVVLAMFLAERATWPGSDRIEWPNAIPSNPYQQAFLWIRANTPPNAVFAFNPQLVYRQGEDEQGFRALAERDHLADDKDAGIVAVVPSLADRWAAQRNADAAVEIMTDAQRQATLTPLGVTWLVLAPETPTNLTCPWRNHAVKICRMN